jgi:hypothetical protein
MELDVSAIEPHFLRIHSLRSIELIVLSPQSIRSVPPRIRSRRREDNVQQYNSFGCSWRHFVNSFELLVTIDEHTKQYQREWNGNCIAITNRRKE